MTTKIGGGYLRKFLGNFVSTWGSGVTGIASIPFTVLCLYTGSTVQRIAYGITAVLLFAFSSYQVWLKEYKRTETLESELRTRQKDVTSQEWKDMATKLGEVCQHFRADYQIDSLGGYQNWDIKGGHESVVCEGRIGMAGAMLLRSPHVYLPDEVRNETIHVDRWLRFMKHHGCFEMHYPIPYEVLEDGRKNFLHSGTTRNLVLDAVRLCVYCSTVEL